MAGMSATPQPQRDGTVARVLRLLMIFGEADGPIGVHQIARQSRLPISSVHRLVNLMTDDGFIHYDTATRLYSLGAQMHRLTAMLWSAGPAVVAQPILNDLSKKFDETVVLLLYLPDQLAISPIAKCDGTRSLRYVFNMNAPIELAWGAPGKSVLTHLDETTIRQVYKTARLSSLGVPLPEWEEYLEHLRGIRERGYAASAGERTPGAQAVASGVLGTGNQVVGGITMTFPQDRLCSFSVEEFGAEVSAAARELSVRLGARVDQ
jgi:DNA-binding IclR family transcriptional regulator